jgi:hypothetical protein
MQLRKMTWLPVALGALGMVLAACGGTHDLSCSVDRDCLESEVCHPDDRVCVQLCTTSVDCPDTATLCEALSDANPVKICKCQGSNCPDTTSP